MKSLKVRMTVFSLVSIFALMFGSMIVSASTTVNITSHNIASGVKMYYYNGNGYSMAKGQYLTLTAYFDNAYQTSAGYYEVTNMDSYTAVGVGTRSSIYFNKPMPKTALYKAWIKNHSSVTMRVTSGTIEY